jgi:hypothetical protein
MQAALDGGKTETERSDRRRQRMGSKGDREGNSEERAQGVAPGSSPGCRYAIRVEGLLDAHWSQWLDGVTITHEEGGVTRLEGALIDQGALHGLLNKLRDLRLTIVTVHRLGVMDTAAPPSPEPPESAA